MQVSIRNGAASWMVVMVVAGLFGIGLPAKAAPTSGPTLSAPETIEWPAPPAPAPDVAAAARPGLVVAQSQINPGPLQGPLSAPGASGPALRCVAPTHRVAHRRRVTHQAARVVPVAVPVVPVYAYPPPVFYRPAPLFYRVRPFYRPSVYPYLYRPYFRPYVPGPFGYGRGFY